MREVVMITFEDDVREYLKYKIMICYEEELKLQDEQY